MQKFLVFALCFISVNLFSQTNYKYESPNDIYATALEQYSNDQFDECITTLDKLCRNDSIYATSLELHAVSLYSTKKFDDLLSLYEEEQKHSKDILYELLFYKGLAYLGNKNYKQSIQVFTQLHEQFPVNHLMLHNLGVSYLNDNQIEKAEKAFQEAILFNAYSPISHRELGNICISKGLIVQAILSYSTSLMLSPDQKGALSLLANMDALLGDIPNNSADSLRTASDEDFSEIELVLKNYIALNKNYKITNKLQIRLVKQLHALVSLAVKDTKNTGFWARTYLPFYKSLMAEGRFDTFIYQIIGSTSNESYQKVIQAHEKDLEEFRSWAGGSWAVACSESDLQIDQTAQREFWYYNDGKVSNIGRENKEKQKVGLWKNYSDKGIVASKGNYSNDKRDGVWEWYYPSGNLMNKAVYTDGKFNGEAFIYKEDGSVEEVMTYTDGKLNGNMISYRKDGSLAREAVYLNGNDDKTWQFYYPLGEDFVKNEQSYKNGKVDGEVREYYTNKSLYRISRYKDGVIVGKEEYFYRNGKKLYEFNFESGKLNSVYTGYYPSGNINEKGQYLEGNKFGLWTEFYDSKIKKGEIEYNKEGEIINTSRNYDSDGKLTSEFQYRRGDIVEYTHYSKDGKVLHTDKKSKGKFNYVGFSELGYKTIEGSYLFNGGKDGLWKYYTDYGVLKSTQVYLDGKLEGDMVNYYPDGKTVKIISPYKQDKLEGSRKVFYPDGTLKSVFNCVDNLIEGKSYQFYSNGAKQNEFYYFHDELQGLQSEYSIEGTLTTELNYEKGRLLNYITYTTTKAVIDSVELSGKNREITTHYPNGTIKQKRNYLYGKLHGKYQTFYMNGKVEVEGQYFNDKYHGPIKAYSEAGILTLDRNYEYGDKVGVWKSYYDSGKIKEIELYENDLDEGKEVYFYETGDTLNTMIYKEGVRDGRSVFFAPGNKVELIRFYKKGNLIGYSYQDKTGKEIPMIVIENGKVSFSSFYSNGVKSRDMSFFNGNIDSQYREFYDNGKLNEVSNWSLGGRNGLDEEFYLNGKKKQSMFYKNGLLHGEYKKYYSTGKLKKAGKFFDGLEHGNFEYYAPSGKLTMKRKYISGELYEEERF